MDDGGVAAQLEGRGQTGEVSEEAEAMSVHVSSWVWKHSKAKGLTRIILLAIADMINEQGLCWPSNACLAKKCRVSKRAIQENIRKLVRLGELKIEQGGGIFGGKRTTNRFRVIHPKRERCPKSVASIKPLSPLQTMPYQEYLETPEWKTLRDQKLKQAQFRCQLCNSPKELNVHHRTYERRGIEELGDLIVLCRRCHEKFHSEDPEVSS
jgi:hypothetical protein